MRIFITGQTYYPGDNGQAIFTIRLAEGLAAVGHEVHVITPAFKLRYSHEMINGVHVHSVRALAFNGVHQNACLPVVPIREIRGIFEAYPPDVVHIQDHYFVNRDVLRVAKERHVPIIGTNHFLPENVLPYLRMLPLPRQAKIGIMWGLMLLTYNHLDLVTTPTETAAGILRHQRIDPPVLAVSCGVDIQRFYPAPGTDRGAIRERFGLDPEKTTFLYVGRQDREKRIDVLVRAMHALVQSGHGNKMQLAVAGQGAAQAELRSLATALGLDGIVNFLGYVPAEQLPDLYRAVDVFAMPSPEELQSIATLEAMACARPILAANARALPELVTSGVNGYLFEAGDAQSAAEGMLALAQARADWERMGAASRSRAAAHSLENTIHRYEEIYYRMETGRGERKRHTLDVHLSPAD